MKVSQVMTGTPACCRPETNLGAAVELMWNYNCGILPIVDANDRVTGVITDRDICVALGTRNKPAGEIRVAEVCPSQTLLSCRPDDEVRTALNRMAQGRVRRLPVLDENEKLAGILSMDDIVTHAQFGREALSVELSTDDVVRILNLVYRPELPARVH
ncbi:MAG TPA: CBS domain-containing protein [Candidatus Acidoferrales bacterium]|nr:CBS domain-containing protein [Candidatus Acidoferrales bacterium]